VWRLSGAKQTFAATAKSDALEVQGFTKGGLQAFAADAKAIQQFPEAAIQ